MLLTLILFLLFGLLVGSFLNVVIVRARELETLLGRSMCRQCREQIRWYDNIPLLSFIILRGKCRDCKKSISWQYPVVEITTAILFACAGALFFSPLEIASWFETGLVLLVIAVGIVVLVFDAQHLEIPMVTLWTGIIATIIFLVLIDFATGADVLNARLHSGIVAGTVACIPLFLLSALSRERLLGAGDGYVALWMGLVLGHGAILFALLLAFIIGGVVAAALLLTKKVTRKTAIPLGPFLIVGMFITLFAQQTCSVVGVSWCRFL